MMSPIAPSQGPAELAAREREQGADHALSPSAVAIRHLRRRPVAMACFILLLTYFLIAGLSYVRGPGDANFIGEWFEAKAVTQHVDPLNIPLDYEPPRLTPLDLSRRINERTQEAEYTAEQLSGWERPGVVDLILGTDIQGRSVFWRTLYAARMSMTVALGATVLAVVLGTFLGAIAGYLGGWVDVVITWLFTTVASIPRILLILALAYSLKGKEWLTPEINLGLTTLAPMNVLSGTLMLILAMGLTTWVGFCRVIRGEIMKQKSMDYEAAARAVGVSPARILMRHLMPNAFYLVIIQVSLIFPLFIHLEVILSYLGLGADEGVSWGQMINESLQEMIRTPPVWWQLVSATLAIFGVSLALNLFGDALRDALDPRLQGQTKSA